MFINTFYSINHLNHQSYYPISENNEIKLSTFPIQNFTVPIIKVLTLRSVHAYGYSIIFISGGCGCVPPCVVGGDAEVVEA